MQANFFQIAIAILTLLLLAVAWGVVIFLFFWAIGHIIKWLLKFKRVEKQVSRIQWALWEWWMRHKPEFISIWEFVSEMLINPIFFSYAIFVLFNKLAAIIDYAKTHPQYSFLQLLDQDMVNDMNFYAMFLLVFFLWMLGRAWAYRQQNRNQRAILKSLGAIAKKLGVDEDEYNTIKPKRKEPKQSNHFDSAL